MLAKGLDAHGLHWHYEEFQLPYFDREGILRFYTPDFYVREWRKFIEVKTSYDKEDKEKMHSVERDNPGVRLEVWTKKDISSWTKKNVLQGGA